MLFRFNLNKFKEQKWLYFFAGSLFTALLSGGFVYFDVYSVMGLSKLQSDPAQNLPALIADSRAEIYGGLTTNQTSNAESGLIVLGGVYTDPNTGQDVLKGKVGLGFPSNATPTEMLEVRGNVKIVDRGDTPDKEALTAPAISSSEITTTNIKALSGSSVTIDGELKIQGERGKSTSTVDTTLLIRTSDGSYVDIGDVFEVQSTSQKVWTDGTPFSWEYTRVYDNMTDITTNCSGTTGTEGLRGYRVSQDLWYEVTCVNNPYPSTDFTCTGITYNDDKDNNIFSGLARLFSSFIHPVNAAYWCDDYSWEQSSPQPSGFPKNAWDGAVQIKIKSEYIP